MERLEPFYSLEVDPGVNRGYRFPNDGKDEPPGSPCPAFPLPPTLPGGPRTPAYPQANDLPIPPWPETGCSDQWAGFASLREPYPDRYPSFYGAVSPVQDGLSPNGLAWDDPHCPMPDPYTGNLIVDPDISLKAKKFPLDINFYFSAYAGSNAQYGNNRRSSLLQTIAPIGGTLVTLTRGDFTQYGFSQIGTSGGISTYVGTTAGAISTLSYQSSNEQYIEYFPDGSTQGYVTITNDLTNAYLGYVKDAGGVVQTYTYAKGNGMLSQYVLHTIGVYGGRTVTFTPAASSALLQSIEDWSGRFWTFSPTGRTTTWSHTPSPRAA